MLHLRMCDRLLGERVHGLLALLFCFVAAQLIFMVPVLEKGALRVQAACIAMFLLFAAVIAVPSIPLLAFAALGMSVAALVTTLEYP